MKDPYFFGYGSLVNDATHTYPDTRAAKLVGWKRAWVGTPARGVVLLTAVPSAHDTIMGLIAAVPQGDWAGLDAREQGYQRVRTQAVQDHGLDHDTEMAVYSVQEADRFHPDGHVILMSYLDVVVQGFVKVFGPQGAQHFFDTTEGWDTPILNDRDKPIYPRHQVLSQTETRLVDDHLKAVSATVVAHKDGLTHQF